MKSYVVCVYSGSRLRGAPISSKYPDAYITADKSFGPIEDAIRFDNIHDASLFLRELYWFYGMADVYCIHVVK